MVKTILNFQTTSLLIRLSLDILVALNSDRYNVLCDEAIEPHIFDTLLEESRSAFTSQ